MKTLYLECNMGAAGDMLMAALYEVMDEGQRAEFLDAMGTLGLPGVEIVPVSVSSCGIRGTHMRVTVQGMEEHEHGHGHDHEHGREHGHEHHHHHHATPGHIAEMIDALNLPREVKTRAREVYDAIAQAEAQAHGCEVSDVHYHEVGALDAVADVVGVCYAMYLLGPDAVIASPVHVGSGTVRCAHGVMPVPAPATAALLKGIPTYGGALDGELCTPTGAALLKCLIQSCGPMPPMAAEKIGYGMGTKEFPGQPNCVRAFWGESVSSKSAGEVAELVCTIDDMTPEALAFSCAQLMELGALDVYTVPAAMKKGRSGHMLTVLCPLEKEGELARQILLQTSTNGLRVRRCGRYVLAPGEGRVQTAWGPVRVKTAQGYGVSHAKPEYEDVAALARANALPFQTVWEDAMRRLTP